MEQNKELKIEYIEIDALMSYEKNSKVHTPSQVKHIANSIEKFGFNDPIGISGENNLILEGHGRVEALRLLGYKKAPCIRLDHLCEEERKAYIIAHNSTNMETGFDEKILIEELKNLEKNYDFNSLGLEVEKYLKEIERVDLSKKIKLNYDIIISCDSEKQQEEFYNKLSTEGYSCKVST